MSEQLQLTIRPEPSALSLTQPGHYVEYTDETLTRRLMGPMGGYEALRLAKRLVTDPSTSEVVYIGRSGQRHGEAEIREALTGRRRTRKEM